MTGRVAEPPDAGQWFPDALGGSDGMGDPAPTMPVLDVYPDALSSSMPDDMVRFVRPVDPAETLGRVRVDAPAGQQYVAPPPPQRPAARPGQPRAAQARPAQPRTAVPRQPAPRQAAAGQRPQVARQAQPRPGQPAPYAGGPSGDRQSHARSPAEMVANVRAAFGAQPQQHQGAVASHQYQPQPSQQRASTSSMPRAVAPAPPSGRPGQANIQQIRRQAHQAGRTSKSRGSSAIAVLVFIVVVLLATGLGERLITMLTALFQR